jgi:hypothetical protein
MLDDEEQSRTLIRLEAKLDVLENLKADIEPWRMEERDVSAREALANVIAHIVRKSLNCTVAAKRSRIPSFQVVHYAKIQTLPDLK